MTPLEYLLRYVSSDGDVLRGRIKAYHKTQTLCFMISLYFDADFVMAKFVVLCALLVDIG